MSTPKPREGRASFIKRGEYTLPSDVKLVTEQENQATGQTLVIVRGLRLPQWAEGTYPWSFRSLAELLAYREGNHSLEGL